MPSRSHNSTPEGPGNRRLRPTPLSLNEPQRQPSSYMLAGLARMALLQGQFERTRSLTLNLIEFAAQFDNPAIRALALAYQGILTLVVHEDAAEALRLFNASRSLAMSPSNEGLIERGLIIIAWMQGQPSAAHGHFAAALQASPIGYGVVDVLLAALLDSDTHPDQAVQYLSLGWHTTLPDGGWLTHSPLFRRIALALQQQLGADSYQYHWQTGEHLALRSVLAAIVARYTTGH